MEIRYLERFCEHLRNLSLGLDEVGTHLLVFLSCEVFLVTTEVEDRLVFDFIAEEGDSSGDMDHPSGWCVSVWKLDGSLVIAEHGSGS